MRVCRLKGLGLAAVVAGTGIAVQAADYTWLGLSANWLDAGNWKTGGATVDWANGNVAIFEPGGPNLDIAINSAVSPGQMTIRDNYVFSGLGPVTLNGYCYVKENMTATYEVPLKSTTQFKKGATGTAVIKGGAELAKLLVSAGTLCLAEGTNVQVTAASTSANSESSLALTGGNLVLEKDSKLELTATSSFVPNSGTGVTISGGTLDASKVGEFLIGFNDINKSSGNMVSKRSFVTVENGGQLLTKTIRLSKATKTELTDNPEYARLNLNTNGFVTANNIYIENNTYYGVINFNGGVLEHNPTQKQVDGKTYAMISHANMSLKVKEGGAHIKLVNGSLNRTFGKTFESAAERDGGFMIEGAGGVAYMNVTNSFNGPTTLTGTGGLIYVPKFDRALGLEPAEPTDNIVFLSGNPIFHSDYAWTVHSNRNVRIAKNVVARIGNGQDLALAGAIRGEEGATASTAINVLSNWGGSLTLVPVAGRESEFGRLITEGHTVIGAGMTKLTSQSTDVHSSAVLYAKGDDKTWGWKGTLDITNGTLKVTDTAHKAYLETAKWGRIRVTGGTLDCLESHEILNGHDGPGRVEVSGTGVINAYLVRVSQATTMEGDLPASCIYLGKGGTLKFHHFNIDASAKPKGRVDFDGGTLMARSARDGMLGDGKGAWTNILFRVCKGGLIFDTNNQKMGIQAPLLTGVTEGKDGGLTKKGSNVLYIKNGNFTYTGPTRTDMGQLIFSDKEDGTGTFFALPGDVEVSVTELSKLSDSQRLGTYIEAKSISANAKLRVADVSVLADGTDPRTTFGKKIAILKTKEPMTKVPEIVLVDKDGNEKPSDGRWSASLSADRKTLTFGPNWITMIIVR